MAIRQMTYTYIVSTLRADDSEIITNRGEGDFEVGHPDFDKAQRRGARVG